jgi:cholest-4-en-3-one 26-monooxygenase
MTDPDLADVDLLDPVTHRAGPPHDVFARLRRDAPVFLHHRADRPPFWVVSRHRDVVRVSRDQATFSSQRNGALLDEQPAALLGSSDRTTLVNLDPPEHTRLRGLVGSAFTAAATDRMERRIRTLCTLTLDRVSERGECDFVRDVAAEFSLWPIAELVGFGDAEDRRRVGELTAILDDPLEQTVPYATTGATMELFEFARELADHRRRVPGDDLVGVLTRVPPDGEPLTTRQFELFFLLLATAGHLTSQHLLSGALLALLEAPDQWERLRTGPGLAGTAPDELLRWVSPVLQFQRTAVRDTEIAGQPIAAGDRVALYYASANRDEAVFERPDRLDLGRSPNPHVSFGAGGPHHCLGSSLARLEIRVLFEELARRMPDIELAGPVERLGSTFVNGLRSMPVRFTPGPRERR